MPEAAAAMKPTRFLTLARMALRDRPTRYAIGLLVILATIGNVSGRLSPPRVAMDDLSLDDEICTSHDSKDSAVAPRAVAVE